MIKTFSAKNKKAGWILYTISIEEKIYCYFAASMNRLHYQTFSLVNYLEIDQEITQLDEIKEIELESLLTHSVGDLRELVRELVLYKDLDALLNSEVFMKFRATNPAKADLILDSF